MFSGFDRRVKSVKFSDVKHSRRRPRRRIRVVIRGSEQGARPPLRFLRVARLLTGLSLLFQSQVASAIDSNDSGRFSHLLSVWLNSLRLTGLVR
jgi:hypothetical protein